jgi:phosphoglucosamine mutase
MGSRFGTDGIRGAVGSEITVDLALALGRAVGHRHGAASEPVLIGRDTRRSGEMLSAALAAGLTSSGADVIDLGVVTTPCLVHASGQAGAPAIMVSASHNPAPDNGLKVIVGLRVDPPREAGGDRGRRRPRHRTRLRR